MDAQKDSHNDEATATISCTCKICLLKKYIVRLLLIGMVVLIFFALKYYYANAKKATESEPKQELVMRVLVGETSLDDVPIYINALGSVSPSSTVTIRSQVNGILMRVLFQEGQMVDADSLIAEIDARPYQAQLLQMEGQLTRDRALLLNAKLDLARYEKLIKQDAISQQTLDTQIALVKQYEGDVESDLGQIEAARLNLDYCRIKSPIYGRAGLQLIDPGNLIQTTDATGIVTINTTRPINVMFSIPEDQLTMVAKKIATGESLKVNIQDRSQNQLLTVGKLVTMDNQIDPTTGTIKLEAEVTNEDDLLFPNQFVNVQLLVDTLKQATVIPTPAIQYSVNGNFVYVLNEDNTVSIKSVKIGASTANKTVIDDVLKPGQKVVIQGADQLKDGMKVTVLSPDADNGTAK
jgi:multidrug efflux system membrane fusion protein